MDEIRDDLGEPQLQSRFFARLPLEIRREIYHHYWGQVRHVVAMNPTALDRRETYYDTGGSRGNPHAAGGASGARQYISSPCLVHSDDELAESPPDRAERGMTRSGAGWGYDRDGELRWVTSLYSGWDNHRKCEEAFLLTRWQKHAHHDGGQDTVASISFVCKRM